MVRHLEDPEEMDPMPMIKRGDGSTGRIVESRDGDSSGVCTGCGKIFPIEQIEDGVCGACSKEAEPMPESTEADDAKAADDDAPSEDE